MWVEEKIKNGKLLCVSVTCENHKISNIKISGDFFIYPEDDITLLESCFHGISIPFDEQKLLSEIISKTSKTNTIGFDVSDLIRLVKRAANK